jgi:ribosomal protein L11 methyltransferase
MSFIQLTTNIKPKSIDSLVKDSKLVNFQNADQNIKNSQIANAGAADKLSDIFLDLGALSVSIEDQHTGTELEQAIFNEPGMEISGLWNESRIIALFAENTDISTVAANAMSALEHEFSYTTDIIADQDWVTLTQNQFTPIKIKDNFYIVPSWHNSPNSHAINITLDPGLAFGTGSHPTTFMCLEWIANNVSTSISTLLDYGCGSGILAIAAKKFDAKNVYGVDIDQQAITSSISNSTDNKVEIKLCSPSDLPDMQFDIVIANILSNPLRILAPTLARLTKQTLVLSGILEAQADELSEIYSHWFNVKIAQNIDGWVLLECNKKA